MNILDTIAAWSRSTKLLVGIALFLIGLKFNLILLVFLPFVFFAGRKP